MEKSFQQQAGCHLADEELMGQVSDLDADAFAIIYDRHVGAAFALAYRILGREQMSEDVLQEAFMIIWKSANRYDAGKGSCRSWILTIVHHQAVDYVRKITRSRQRAVTNDEAAEQVPDTGPGPQQQTVDGAVGDRLLSALETIPDQQRQAIEMAYYGGFTHREIAETLAIAPGTVKGRIRLGLEKMYKEIGHEPVI